MLLKLKAQYLEKQGQLRLPGIDTFFRGLNELIKIIETARSITATITERLTDSLNKTIFKLSRDEIQDYVDCDEYTRARLEQNTKHMNYGSAIDYFSGLGFGLEGCRHNLSVA